METYYCKDKVILRKIANKLREKASRLEALAYEQEEKELKESRNLIEPLLCPTRKGGEHRPGDRIYLEALEIIRRLKVNR